MTTGFILVWSDSRTAADRVFYVVAVGGVACFMGALCTARIVANGDTLILRNIFLDVSIPAESITSVDGLHGVVVTTSTGEFESTAYGTSVLGDLRVFESARRADRTLEDWLQDHQGTARLGASHPPRARRTLRRWWYVVSPTIIGVSGALSLVLLATLGVAD